MLNSPVIMIILKDGDPSPRGEGGGGIGGDAHMKGAGMLVASLRGVNFRFWSHLECSGQNTIIFSHKGLF